MPAKRLNDNLTLYGIKNCDTIKKARKWLDQKDVEHTFHDFREDGLNDDTIGEWLSLSPPNSLINKRSTTWKQLEEGDKESLEKILANNVDLGKLKQAQANTLKKILKANPTLVKRPVLVAAKGSKPMHIEVGFSEKLYAALL